VQLGITIRGTVQLGTTTGGMTTGGVVPVVWLRQAPTHVPGGAPDPPFWLLVELVNDLWDSPSDSTCF
jgi:hypothetical protein